MNARQHTAGLVLVSLTLLLSAFGGGDTVKQPSGSVTGNNPDNEFNEPLALGAIGRADF